MSRFAVVTTDQFNRDVERTINWSKEQFGLTAARRYQGQIRSALRQLATDPTHPSVRGRVPGLPHVLSLHLRHVPGEVKEPRHVLYVVVDQPNRRVSVLRLLHEAMDVERALSRSVPPEVDDRG